MFGKRRWALRVVEAAGIHSGTAKGVELVDMLIVGAKQNHEMVRSLSHNAKVDDLDFILMSARAMADNGTAIARVEHELGIGAASAIALLETIRDAAMRVFEGEGRVVPSRPYDPTS